MPVESTVHSRRRSFPSLSSHLPLATIPSGSSVTLWQMPVDPPRHSLWPCLYLLYFLSTQMEWCCLLFGTIVFPLANIRAIVPLHTDTRTSFCPGGAACRGHHDWTCFLMMRIWVASIFLLCKLYIMPHQWPFTQLWECVYWVNSQERGFWVKGHVCSVLLNAVKLPTEEVHQFIFLPTGTLALPPSFLLPFPSSFLSPLHLTDKQNLLLFP